MKRTTAFLHFWQQRNARERRMLAAGLLVLLLLGVWLLLIDPAMQGRTRWHKDLPEMRNELAQMRVLSSEISKLPARTADTLPALSKQSIERSLNDKGLKAQSLNVTERGVSVDFSDIPFAALTEWLQQSQSSAQLVVTDASVSARERIGQVSARVTLQRAQ